MKHFAVIELGNDESPMIGIIDNVLLDKKKIGVFVDRLTDMLKDYYDSNVLTFSLTDEFVGTPYDDIDVTVDNNVYTIRIMEAYFY